MKYVMLLAPLLALATPLAALAVDEDPREAAMDGLEQVEKTRRGAIYADPGIDWSTYDKIRLDPATVAFRKNWQRDQNRQQPNRVRADDVERIKETMARTFDTVFRAELSEDGGYSLTEDNAENVLRITPYIEDLDLYAPRSFLAGSGGGATGGGRGLPGGSVGWRRTAWGFGSEWVGLSAGRA